jgi:hypothetical protein
MRLLDYNVNRFCNDKKSYGYKRRKKRQNKHSFLLTDLWSEMCQFFYIIIRQKSNLIYFILQLGLGQISRV